MNDNKINFFSPTNHFFFLSHKSKKKSKLCKYLQEKVFKKWVPNYISLIYFNEQKNICFKKTFKLSYIRL